MRNRNVRNKLLFTAAWGLAIYVGLSAVPCCGRLRNVRIGETMPEFRLAEWSSEPNSADANAADANEGFFAYRNGKGRALALVFLSSAQRQSKQAAEDIKKILKKLQGKTQELDFAIVVYGPQAEGLFRIKQPKPGSYRVLSDGKYQLWGKLGIIAMPTVLVVGKDDKILWTKAGYGYDFAPALEGALNEALGFAKAGISKEAIKVKTLTNTGVDGRLRRHLQMAAILEHKGYLELAITEAAKAMELDANSVAAALYLGRLYCMTGRGRQALEVISKVTAESRGDNAKRVLVMGWAKRQAEDIEAAEKFLLEATTLNPKSSRAFFELGKVYQAKAAHEKAMLAYRKALSLLFSEQPSDSVSHQR